MFLQSAILLRRVEEMPANDRSSVAAQRVTGVCSSGSARQRFWIVRGQEFGERVEDACRDDQRHLGCGCPARKRAEAGVKGCSRRGLENGQLEVLAGSD